MLCSSLPRRSRLLVRLLYPLNDTPYHISCQRKDKLLYELIVATSSVCHLRFMTDMVSFVPPPTTLSFKMTRLNVIGVLVVLAFVTMVLATEIEGNNNVDDNE